MDHILQAFGLHTRDFAITPIKTGYINYTYKLTGIQSFILQRINIAVFKNPALVASNIRLAADYLAKNSPDYFFLANVRTPAGEEMVYDDDGYPWRLYPFINNAITINRADTVDKAYNAARGFGELAARLWHCNVTAFQETIPRFHDLSLRFQQFEESLVRTSQERKQAADEAIAQALKYRPLVQQYEHLIQRGGLALHVFHNDTKINNILFDDLTRQVVSVIDLDTLMPGYFIYDLGDMIRTFVSPVTEEEEDTTRVVFRDDFYRAVVDGYFSAMSIHLEEPQRALAPFAGAMMTYIMALRMLADFLNGNVYYQVQYENQNLVRATNQFALLHAINKVFRLV